MINFNSINLKKNIMEEGMKLNKNMAQVLKEYLDLAGYEQQEVRRQIELCLTVHGAMDTLKSEIGKFKTYNCRICGKYSVE